MKKREKSCCCCFVVDRHWQADSRKRFDEETHHQKGQRSFEVDVDKRWQLRLDPMEIEVIDVRPLCNQHPEELTEPMVEKIDHHQAIGNEDCIDLRPNWVLQKTIDASN